MLKFTVDSLDDVEETHRGLYAERDGKFVLTVEGLPEPDGLKTALEKERELRKKYERQIKGWEKVGKTPEEIADLVTQAEERARKKAEDEGDFQTLLQQHQAKWDKERTELQDELSAARDSERGTIIENSLLAALTKAGATEEGIDLLPERLAHRIKFERDGSKRVVKIMAADGETPLAGSAQNGTATFEDLVKETVEKYPSLFKSNGAGGSGKLPDGKAGRAGVTKKSDLKTEKDRAKFVDEHGLAAYQALPD